MPLAINNLSGQSLRSEIFFRTAEIFFRQQRKKNWHLSLALVKDRAMRRLNKERLGHDYSTDVLAFNLGLGGELDRRAFSGEIILGYDQIARQAKAYKQKTTDELLFVFTHGLFHLVGYRDHTAAKRKAMHKMASEFLNKAGLWKN